MTSEKERQRITSLLTMAVSYFMEAAQVRATEGQEAAAPFEQAGITLLQRVNNEASFLASDEERKLALGLAAFLLEASCQ